MPTNGDLSRWAAQGVLLLNTSLTVEAHRPASHSDKGWEEVTDEAIIRLSQDRENIVFILWGSHAQRKAPLIDVSKHLVLRAPHPSPLSAYRGFFGCKHFSQANAYLLAHNQTPIIW
jgi:uracil-DNA glycosylase